jgi:uncharacterized protein involved in type VI secretion and phage assembly
MRKYTSARKVKLRVERLEDRALMSAGVDLGTIGSHLVQASAATMADYSNQITLIPSSVPYRPTVRTTTPTVTAFEESRKSVVVQTPGQGTDQYPPMKVQFYWDQSSKGVDSEWARLISPSTGGSMMLPRIGMEVVVDFLEGDPDRPIISGRVYNSDVMPPYVPPVTHGFLPGLGQGGKAAQGC